MTSRLRYHPAVRDDLKLIRDLIADYSGSSVAADKLREIERAVLGLADQPHRGTLRDEIAPGLRAIPAGRRGVVAFVVDDAAREVRVMAITYGGADWMGRVARLGAVPETRRGH